MLELQSRRPDGFRGQRQVIVPQEIVQRASQAPVTRDLCVTHIGAFAAAQGHYVERIKGAQQHIMIACLAGRGSCTLSGRLWNVLPGNVLFLPPHKKHTYNADPAAPWTILWVHFHGQKAEDYQECLGISAKNPVAKLRDTAAIADAFEDTYQHTQHGFSESAMVGMATAFARLLGLARVYQKIGGNRAPESERRLLQTLELMRQELARPWTLETLAGKAELSPTHFTELCRQQTGLPPLSLLIRLRLQHAMGLLQQGEHNVAEAARAVGYSDPFYFSRLFRKHMGVTPSSCRNGP